MKRLAYLSLMALTLLLALVANLTAEETKVMVPMGADGVQKINIVAGSYFFKPAHIIVKANAPVEVMIRKERGMAPHSFVLRAPEAGMDIKLDLDTDPKTVRFTPTKTGTYSFYCDQKLLFFKSHREKGMEGVLEVQE